MFSVYQYSYSILSLKYANKKTSNSKLKHRQNGRPETSEFTPLYVHSVCFVNAIGKINKIQLSLFRDAYYVFNVQSFYDKT